VRQIWVRIFLCLDNMTYTEEQQFNETLYKNCTDQLISPTQMKEISNEKLTGQSTRVGLLFASKAAVQLVVNPFIGPITNK